MRWILCCVLSVSFLGCGGGGEPQTEETFEEEVVNQDESQIRSVLEDVANSGTVAVSSLYGLDKSLENLGKPELVDELNKIPTAKPEQAKKIAQGILDKL